METTTTKKPYEVVVLMHPDASLEEQKDLFKKNKATIESYKGSINSLETWGKRTLATPIGKLKKSYLLPLYIRSRYSSYCRA
ncbi:30S ribosomal protein S6 [Bdellovibrio bacteriovorus]|uniref:30S ribosomal protein S6 n=1 Tax=Bdellovibrio bacteriovorus TaxID=959 RepID=UPI0035A573C3